MKNLRCLKRRWIGWGVLFILMMLFLYSCAIPVRQVYKVDGSVPVGSIRGDYFVGQRYPFQVKIPAGWQADTQYPEFLVEQGYSRESGTRARSCGQQKGTHAFGYKQPETWRRSWFRFSLLEHNEFFERTPM